MAQDIDKTPLNMKWALRKMSEFLPPTKDDESWIPHLIWTLWTYSNVWLEKEEVDAGRIHFDAEASYPQLADTMHCAYQTAKWRCEQMQKRYPLIFKQQRSKYSNEFEIRLEAGMVATVSSLAGFDETGAPILSKDPEAIAAYQKRFEGDEEELECPSDGEAHYTPFDTPWDNEPDPVELCDICGATPDACICEESESANELPISGSANVLAIPTSSQLTGDSELANRAGESANRLATLSLLSQSSVENKSQTPSLPHGRSSKPTTKPSRGYAPRSPCQPSAAGAEYRGCRRAARDTSRDSRAGSFGECRLEMGLDEIRLLA